MTFHSPRLSRKIAEVVRALWFVPAMIALAGVALGILMPWVDAVPAFHEGRSGWLRTVVDSAPVSAQQLLATSAGALATILGVAFSLTLVTLQLAAAQYTSRLLGRLLEDRVTKIVLGCYLGTVAYLLLVLRSVHGVGDGKAPFVPRLSISLALVLILGCLGLLAYFVHHLGRTIQAANLIARVGRRTISRLDSLARDDDGRPGRVPNLDGDPVLVRARRSGYVQLVDVERLARAAPAGANVVRVDVSAGDFVIAGTPVFSVWSRDELGPSQGTALRKAIAVGAVRTDDQDVLFGIRQLADIALKALSPGLNDETTAIAVVNELGAILAAAGDREAEPGEWRTHRRGEVTVLTPALSLRRMAEDAFGGIVRSGADHPRVLARIVEVVSQVAATLRARGDREVMHEIGSWVESLARWREFAPHEERLVRSRLDQLRTPREEDPARRPHALH